MLFISSRRELSNEDKIGPDEFWNVKTSRGMATSRRQLGGLAEVQAEVAGKRALLLVHGYNNEFEDIVRAYDIIERQTKKHMSGKYDVVLAYTWPGGDSRLDYFAAKTRSGSLAPRFSDNLADLHRKVDLRPKSLDIMTHSMGSRLVLESLKHLSSRGVVRNLMLLASAVDNESLEKSEEYFTANRRVRNSFVFHSRHDQVLGVGYRMAEFDRALGQHGPEDPADMVENSEHTLVVNCKNRIRGHGDYKSEDEIYKYLAANVDAPRVGQFATL